jgi:hypothetical protein
MGTIISPASTGSWGVRSGASIVPLEAADAALLLSASSGLAAELVHAGAEPLAMAVTAAYLRLRPDHGVCPITSLGHVETGDRAFPAICLTDCLNVRAAGQRLKVPVNLIQKITVRSARGWTGRSRTTIELVDGSIYRHAAVMEKRLDVLTLLGRQSVSLTSRGTKMRGHSVGQLAELRARVELALQRHRQSVVAAVGRETFERFFPAA